MAASTDDQSLVLVPSQLAKRIRLALDHAHRGDLQATDKDGERIGNLLATELCACPGYPLESEPWS